MAADVSAAILDCHPLSVDKEHASRGTPEEWAEVNTRTFKRYSGKHAVKSTTSA